MHKSSHIIVQIYGYLYCLRSDLIAHSHVTFFGKRALSAFKLAFVIYKST